MRVLDTFDLASDPLALHFIKDEEVAVVFAREAGELPSREDPNPCRMGDTLLTGSTGDFGMAESARFRLICRRPEIVATIAETNA